MTKDIHQNPPPPSAKQPSLLRQAGAICGMVLAFYFLLFPLPVIAADAVGVSIRQKTGVGKVITAPLVWTAEHLPPYKAYLETSRRLIGMLYTVA